MKKILLQVFSVTIGVKHAKTLEPISSWGPKKDDLLTLIANDLKSSKKRVKNEIKQQTLKKEPCKYTPSKDQIYGFIHVGEYGHTGVGINIDTEKPSYMRSRNDSEEIPLFFTFYRKENENKGYLVFQRFGSRSPRQALESIFQSLIDKIDARYSVRFCELALEKVVQEFLKKGTVSEITLIKNELPKEVEARMKWQSSGKKEQKSKAKVCLTIKTSFGQKILDLGNSVKNILFDKEAITTLIEYPNFTYDDAFVKFCVNGRTKTFNLSKPTQVRTHLDISNDVDIEPATGHPKLESIFEHANDLLVQYLKG